MTQPQIKQRGIVYTFYSFKGGVGRTMALANVAALIAEWGHSVLIVDWDLEAPGLERFFGQSDPDVQGLRRRRPGIVDLIHAKRSGNRLDWHDCIIPLDGALDSRLSLITAGRADENYTDRLHSLDFPALFERHDLGSFIEKLRDEWTSEFDFVLVDSRTGFTDIGGICTVHLADILVLLFTTSESSLDGTKQIVERARIAQERLPLDRARLLAVPVPARDESRTEYELAELWKGKFVKAFDELYRDWLPTGITTENAMELLRIPYVPFWSFGEQLPAIADRISDPSSLGHAYGTLARILAARLDWYAALQGETLAPPPMRNPRTLDIEWLERHRRAALEGLKSCGIDGFMEISHFCTDPSIRKTQSELLSAARQAVIHTYGWPIGVVLNTDAGRPRPLNDGIVAKVSNPHQFVKGRSYDYWALGIGGDFFTLMSLLEDQGDQDLERRAIFLDTRIARATEAVLHCAALYKALGAQPNAKIELTLRYGGLRGRTLGVASPNRAPSLEVEENLYEDEITIPSITFGLGAINEEIVPLVKKCCEPLFVLFDFATVSDDVYRQIVTDFVKGRIA